MFIKVAALVLIFITRLRFPPGKSVNQTLRTRYGNITVQLCRKFEKTDFKLRKSKLDLEFLEACCHHGFLPRFLQFKVSNRTLRSSQAYKSCQMKLLKEEISNKKTNIRRLEKELADFKERLQTALSFIDFTHVCSLILARNDKEIERRNEVHRKKLFNLGLQTSTSHNPDDVIHNYSSHVLSENEKSLLSKGLNFAIPPGKVKYENYLVKFERLYRAVKELDMSSETRDLLKARLKDSAISSLNAFNNSSGPHVLSREEKTALISLSNNLDLIIQKSDKGNSVVLIDRETYVRKVNEILGDSTKFKKIVHDPNKRLNFIISQERKVTDVLKVLLDKGSLDQTLYDKLRPTGSRLGALYGLCKVHKKSTDGSPPFRPILSAIGTPTYKLAKFLVPKLSPLTSNEYTVSSSFSFAEEIREQDSNLFMASLDVDSLFTNIPLEETIDICVDGLFQENDVIDKMTKEDFRSLLESAAQESCFTFDNILYRQIDGVAMGSPLGPCFANAFLCYHEKSWLDNCPSEFKPVYYRRYVDDIFVLFSSPDHLPQFQEYLNKQHRNINFTSEVEENDCLPFLDISVKRDPNKFATNIYRKPTFSGVYSNFSSFIPIGYKFGLVFTLLHRMFKIVCDASVFRDEVRKLRDILLKNGYPVSFIDNCIRSFFKKIQSQPKDPIQSAEKLEVMICLPYMGTVSLKLRQRLLTTFAYALPCCNLRVVFKSGLRLSHFFKFKDIVPRDLRSKVVYSFQCDGCNSVYYGQTIRHLNVRAAEHIGVSALTGKNIVPHRSAISDHLLFCDQVRPSFENFSIIATGSSEFELELKESLLIHRDKPTLNRTITSTELHLFDD